MLPSDDLEDYVAGELMKSWFPKSHKDVNWLVSEDAINWMDIALADARVAVEAVKYWQRYIYDDGK